MHPPRCAAKKPCVWLRRRPPAGFDFPRMKSIWARRRMPGSLHLRGSRMDPAMASSRTASSAATFTALLKTLTSRTKFLDLKFPRGHLSRRTMIGSGRGLKNTSAGLRSSICETRAAYRGGAGSDDRRSAVVAASRPRVRMAGETSRTVLARNTSAAALRRRSVLDGGCCDRYGHRLGDGALDAVDLDLLDLLTAGD